MGILGAVDKITAGVNPPSMGEDAPQSQGSGEGKSGGSPVSHMLSKVQFGAKAAGEVAEVAAV